MYGHAVPSFLKVTSDEKNWLTLHLKMLVSWLLLKMRVACLLGWYNDFSTFLVTEVKQACSQWSKKVLLCILIPDPLFIKHHWNVCTIFFFHYCPSAPLLSEVQFMGNPITDGCPVNCKWRCTLTYPFPWHDCWLRIPIVALILSLLASAPSAVSAPVDCSLSDTPSTCTCIVMPFVSGKHLVPGTSAVNQHEFVIHLLQSSMVVQRWAEGGCSVDNSNSGFKAPFNMRWSAACTLSPGGQDKEHLCKVRLPFFKDRGLSGY